MDYNIHQVFFFVYISLGSVTLAIYSGIYLHDCTFLFQMSLYKFPIHSVIRYNVI